MVSLGRLKSESPHVDISESVLESPHVDMSESVLESPHVDMSPRR